MNVLGCFVQCGWQDSAKLPLLADQATTFSRVSKADEVVMKLSRHRVLLCGILSPVLALILYVLVYGTLTRSSSDLEKDWLFRLSASTLAMIVPFLITLALAIGDRRSGVLSLSGKIGLVLATLSLGLAWRPINDGIVRSKQVRNMAMQMCPHRFLTRRTFREIPSALPIRKEKSC